MVVLRFCFLVEFCSLAWCPSQVFGFFLLFCIRWCFSSILIQFLLHGFLSSLSEYESSFWMLWLQLKKYYQPRKSNRITLVNIEGTKVPLYGAGSSLAASNNGAVQVPLTLQFDIHSRGNVVGKLVRTKHRVQISCPVVIDSSSTKPMKFKKDSCFYNWFVWCICRLFEIWYGIW